MAEKNIDEKLADQWESLTRTVLNLKAERDEMDESIHAAHAAVVEILPNYHATNGFPVEAVNALGEEIEQLREALRWVANNYGATLSEPTKSKVYAALGYEVRA